MTDKSDYTERVKRHQLSSEELEEHHRKYGLRKKVDGILDVTAQILFTLIVLVAIPVIVTVITYQMISRVSGL